MNQRFTVCPKARITKNEFRSKASVVLGKTHGVILGAYSLPENDYDRHTLDPVLQQVERITKYRPLRIGDIEENPGAGRQKC
jgi:hypothetical protein